MHFTPRYKVILSQRCDRASWTRCDRLYRDVLNRAAFGSRQIVRSYRRAEAVRQGDDPEKRMTTPPPRVVVAALRNRLGAAIAKDWLAAAGLAADRHNTDARTRAARPTNVDEFQERWGSVSDVSDGKCTPRPRKLETEMEPD